MQLRVINLAEHTARWAAASRQFARAGLRVTRQEAIRGEALPSDEVERLYSVRLNAGQYHRPLRAGEIGCYASHLQAWRDLVDAGDAAMAIFEDDIEIDDDLPEVLDTIVARCRPGDLVKLIGRAREKPGSGEPLCGQRRLVSYRRVPSLTGAYVITSAAARQLLAHRQPFGRPVDVDMRHWWECGIHVVGVLPYPVRGAPSSQVSTIGDRAAHLGHDARWRKLYLQGRYTLLNSAARLTRKTDSVPVDPPAGPARPSSPIGMPTFDPLASRPAPRRNLVVLRAGDNSLHRDWINAPSRDFDLFISYYGDTPNRHRDDADFYEMRKGPKWPGLAALLSEHRALVQRYEAVWFPDDDLATESAVIDRMFAFFCAYRLCLAQPALTRNSYFTWKTLLQDESCHIRYARFVEVMAPLFSRAALDCCAHTFAESRSGWGLDWVWPELCRHASLGRIGIIDATPVRHTRPVGGELYRNHPQMDPRADARQLLRRYGIEEVRAIAKYSFEGQVREVALPLVDRMIFWLKRLNGRRKQRTHA